MYERVKHRLQIEGRAADDLEHVGSGGLLLQRLAQLVEQASVLDGDDGLGREILNQINLLVGERLSLLAIDIDSADQTVLLQHRHREDGAIAPELDAHDESRIALDVGLLRRNVRNVGRPLSGGDPAKTGTRAGTEDWMEPPMLGHSWRHVMLCRAAKAVPFIEVEHPELGLADA